MILCVCGCINEIDAVWGIQKNVSKCGFHQDASRDEDTSLAHYELLGCIENGIPQHRRYVAELRGPMNELGVDLPLGYGKDALEIGAGLGMYAPMFLNRGYRYSAIEPLPVPASWIRSTFDADVFEGGFENYHTEVSPHVIMAAHVYEHMKDSPEMLKKAFDLLAPGGQIFIIVPDDRDPTNPDHYWFFTVDGLRRLMEGTGFKDVRITSRSIIAKEDFIYCFATK